jgi:hypothetical protein
MLRTGAAGRRVTMTGEEFLEWSSRTMTPAMATMVGYAFQTVSPDKVEELVVTYLESVKERAVELVRIVIAETRPPRPS